VAAGSRRASWAVLLQLSLPVHREFRKAMDALRRGGDHSG